MHRGVLEANLNNMLSLTYVVDESLVVHLHHQWRWVQFFYLPATFAIAACIDGREEVTLEGSTK